jgi:hypothetical protein
MLSSTGNTATIPDDGTVTMLTITTQGLGIVLVDGDLCLFTVDSSGNVKLIIDYEDIVANANTDGKFCIGTAVQNPIILKNRLGASKVVTYCFIRG